MRRALLVAVVLATVAPLTGGAAEKAVDANAETEAAAPTTPLKEDWSRHLPWRPILAWRAVETATPVLVDGRIFAGSARGRAVFAVDAQSGDKIWTRSVPGQVEAGIAVDDERVYVGDSKGFLTALSRKSGRIIWRESLGGVVLGRVLLHDGTVYAVTEDDRMHAHDAGTGKERWVYRHETPAGITIYGTTSPIVAGGRVVAGFSDGVVVALRTSDGGISWRRRLDPDGRFHDLDGAPELSGSRLFVSTYGGKVYALNVEDGSVLWSDEPGGSSGLTVAEDRLYYGSDDGELVCRAVDDGHIVWRYKMKKGLPAKPVVTDGIVWVGSSAGALYAIDVETGSARWTFAPMSRLSGFNTPVMIGHRRIYALSNAGILYALGEAHRKTLRFQSGWAKRDK